MAEMKKQFSWVLTAALICAASSGICAAETETEQISEAIAISTVDELKAVNENLAGSYVLTADIDLGGEEWTPLGSFVQMSTEGEEAEMPDPAYAFTGTFDGQGHTISNYTVNDPEGWAMGLFGCIANAQVANLNVEHAAVDGATMASAVVGYSFCSNVSGVTVKDAVITAHATEISEEGMYGGVVAAGMMSTIENCSADVQILIPDNTANAGIVGGGLELTSVIGSSAKGTITAGNNCYGLGGISGCGFGAEQFTDCTAEEVTITAGDDCFWIGGLTGYAGGFEEEDAGIPITQISGCSMKDITIQTGENASGVGEIVGSGFFMEGLAETYGVDYYAEPTKYNVADCSTTNVVINASAEEAATEAADDSEAVSEAATEAADASEAATEAATEAAADAEENQNGVLTAIAGENGTTYENFFDVTLAEENYGLWYDCAAAVVGEDAADETISFMQGYISSDLYGEEAIAYYAENPDAQTVFDCFYINGVKLVTFNPDNTISVELEDGSTQTHTYEYLGVYNVGEGETMVYMGQKISVAFPCDVYKSTDEAGEFNYFFLRDDTMEETGHIEFRYGKDLEELQGYFTGPYGYWLTAGFDVNADEDTLKNTVELFVLENMDYSSHAEQAISQISEFIGTWKADLSAFGEEYADTDLHFTIDEAGHGITTMDGVQTADFEAYAYDNGEKGDGAGVYIAYSNLEQEAEAAEYTLETNENGETVLTLYAKDGVISYVKAA